MAERRAAVLAVLAAAGLALAPAGLPVAAAGLPLPVPLPSLPPILPGPSPSPSPSPTPSSGQTAGGGGGGAGQQASAASSSQPFGPGGIVSAFVPPAAASSSAPPASPAPFRPADVPPPQSYIFPIDRGAATQSAIPPLLVGLLLVSLGLWLMSMRHRRQALQSAALERIKTDFLNLASHELRGPLTILKGYVSTAREGHFGELPEAFATRLPTVQNQLARMETLVEQMLETARLDAGHPDVQREVTDLRRLVRSAVPGAAPEGAEHRVDLEVPDIPVEVEIDARRIEQVLRNLVDNALKYSDPPAHVRVRLWTDPERAYVSVTDQGFGIAPEDMKRLFSRFGRLVTDRNSHIPGVGLGLYLGRTVARMHGGELDASSVPGRGSTFTLTLPLHQDQPAAGRAEESPVQRAVRFVSRYLPSRARGSAS